MKKEDVKRGMKVVPVRKTVANKLRDSVKWNEAKDIGQPYLFVIGWRELANAWSLSCYRDDQAGDWFKSGDFKLYKETK